jgi:DNA polymerase-3 subunit gamma/tau
MEELNRLLNAGNSPSQMARQMVRYLRNCLMAKLGGATTELLQVSGDERARAVRSAALFSEEDLTRFLQVMLRTFDELNYRQEPRLHLELGLMKLVHLQRLLPLEQILSGLPGATASAAVAGAARSAEARGTKPIPKAPAVPVPVPAPAPASVSQPAVLSPFELDRQRKLNDDGAEESVLETAPVAAAPVVPQPKTAPVHVERVEPVEPVQLAVEPEPPAATAAGAEAETGAGTDLNRLREVVTAALDEQGHNTAASLLGAGRWKLDQEGAIQVEVGVKKTMLGLTMNAEAWKIVREALRLAGATQKMTVAPGEGADPASASPRVWSRDSIEAVALGNPLVRQAQELFQAEVRSVLDLRGNPGNDSRGKG